MEHARLEYSQDERIESQLQMIGLLIDSNKHFPFLNQNHLISILSYHLEEYERLTGGITGDNERVKGSREVPIRIAEIRKHISELTIRNLEGNNKE